MRFICSMKATQTPLSQCWLLEETRFRDERGHFSETFNQQTFHKLTGLEVHFVQDNQSHSSRGVLRGLHFQKGAYAQAKLVRVLEGAVLDVAVDLRPGSATYGKHFSVELNDENGLQLFIPRGFAHGFVVLSPKATFFYKCDNYYHKQSEGGLLFNDASLGIDWQIPHEELILSDKDQKLPTLVDLTLDLNTIL